MSVFRETFLRNGIELTAEQEEKFNEYFRLLTEYNAQFNLTAITEESEVAVKHFLDSAAGMKFIPDGSNAVDIGSGAGFPAVPLMILNPTLKFTLLDALNKRVGFLTEVCSRLGLNAVCKHKRAEEEAAERRAYYDCAVARAVASLPTILEYALPLLKKGGVLVAYKGEAVEEELKASGNALKTLGGKAVMESFVLDGAYERRFVIVKKVADTPIKYPRGQNKAKNFPL